MLSFRSRENRLSYNITGTAESSNNLMLIHDNGQSSRVFDSELRFYSTYFNTITVDLTGHGKSPRGTDTYDNFWITNAEAALLVCEKLKLKKVSVIGTGGGALVAMNMALLNPGMVKSIIAESMPGLEADSLYVEYLESYRKKARGSDMKQKYQMMNGSRWEKVLDEDTQMQKDFVKRGGHFLHGDAASLPCPVLLTGCPGYDLLPDIEERLKQSSERIKKSQIHIFSSGRYPLFLNRNGEFRTVSLNYIMD